MTRRPHRPGVHGQARRTISEFGGQLKAKQRIKLVYGVNEAQLKNIFTEAARQHGAIGSKIVQMLESRLDNAVFRAGLADSRIMAKHFISRGHFLVNGRKTFSPSYALKPGDVFAVREESKKLSPFKNLKETLGKFSPPSWLEVQSDKLAVKVVSPPEEALEFAGNISAVVEYFAQR